MKAYIFPGQGSQVVGMGEELCKLSDSAREYLEMADDILGYKLSELMIHGTRKELKETKVTQPAVFVYSVVKARITRKFRPDVVAGHSLGEFSALAAIRVLTFADGLRLVATRANAMHELCVSQLQLPRTACYLRFCRRHRNGQAPTQRGRRTNRYRTARRRCISLAIDGTSKSSVRRSY